MTTLTEKREAREDDVTYEVMNSEGKVFIGNLRDCAKFLHVRSYNLGAFLKTGKHYSPRFKGVSAQRHVPVTVKDNSEASKQRKLVRFEQNNLYINRHANYVVCISANHLKHEYKFVAIYPLSTGKYRIAAENNELCVSVTDEYGVTKKKRGVKPSRTIYPIDINGLDQAGLAQFLELRAWYAATKGIEVVPVKVNVTVAQTSTKTTVVSTVKEAGPMTLENAVVDDRLKNLETLMEELLKAKQA